MSRSPGTPMTNSNIKVFLLLATCFIILSTANSILTRVIPSGDDNAGSMRDVIRSGEILNPRGLDGVSWRDEMVGAPQIPAVFSPSRDTKSGIQFCFRSGGAVQAGFGLSRVFYIVDDYLFVLEFPGSNLVVPVGDEPVGSVTNYMIGSDPSTWRTGLQDCGGLRYTGLYPGIDLVYTQENGQLKYEFHVAAGANPGAIHIRYAGADLVEINGSTGASIVIRSGETALIDDGLFAYQESEGSMVHVDCSFVRANPDEVRFVLGSYDPSSPLVIDPIVLDYSTFIGGSDDDSGNGIAVENGYIYITGETGDAATNFPITTGAYDTTHNGNTDVFVTKFAAGGGSLVYSTYLGGSGGDTGSAIAVESGFAYITGYTTDGSPDYPVTGGAYDTSHNGGRDVFVTKLSTDGASLIYSTFFGDSGDDMAYSIAVEAEFAYITGFRPGGTGQAFVAKFASDGGSLIYNNFFGGSGFDVGHCIAVEGGFAYITGVTEDSTTDFPVTGGAFDTTHNGGFDVFVAKLAMDGLSLVYATFLGGGGNDQGFGIDVESGYAYVTGQAEDNVVPFPTTVGTFDTTHGGGTLDAFVTKLSTDGGSLAYSTFIGGLGAERGYDIMAKNGYAYVTGMTGDPQKDFPVTDDSHTTTQGGSDDVFVTKLSATGASLLYSTILGGSGPDHGFGIVVENDLAYIVGRTADDVVDFPVTGNAYDADNNGGNWDTFVCVFNLANDVTPPEMFIAFPTNSTIHNATFSFQVNVYDVNYANVTYQVDALAIRLFPRNASTLVDSGDWLSLTEGVHQITITAADSWGNTRLGYIIFVKDTLAPLTTLSYVLALEPDFVIPATEFNLSASDTGGCGVASTFYRLNGSSWQPYVIPFPAGAVGNGTLLIEYYSVDNVGNAESIKSISVRLDTIAPNTTISYDSFAPNFVNATTTFTLAGTDNTGGSGNLRTEYRINGSAWIVGTSFTISTNGTFIINYRSVDNLDNIEIFGTRIVRVDTVAPNTTLTVFMFISDFTNGTHSFTLSGTDNTGGSEIFYRQYRINMGEWFTGDNFTIPTNGTYTIDYRSVDNVYNVEVYGTRIVRVDTIAPNTTLSVLTFAPNFTNGTRTFTLSRDDNAGGSSILRTEYRINSGSWTTGTSFTIPTNGMYTIDYRSIDNVLNYEIYGTQTFRVDILAPNTTISFTSFAPNFVNGTTTFTLGGADNPGGASLSRREYRVDGGSWIPGNTFTIATNGTHVIDYRSIDNVYNVETFGTRLVRVDTLIPNSTLTFTPSQGSDYINKTTQFTMVATDNSGGADIASRFYKIGASPWTLYAAPFTLGAYPNGTYTILYYSVDNVGNGEAAKSGTVHLDIEGPTITISSPTNATYTNSTIGITLSSPDPDLHEAWYSIGYSANGTLVVSNRTWTMG
nr:hypothetical protein [Candidatus Sigynarchaeota archaeon]